MTMEIPLPGTSFSTLSHRLFWEGWWAVYISGVLRKPSTGSGCCPADDQANSQDRFEVRNVKWICTFGFLLGLLTVSCFLRVTQPNQSS